MKKKKTRVLFSVVLAALMLLPQAVPFTIIQTQALAEDSKPLSEYNIGDIVYKMIIVGINHKSRLIIDHIPILSASLRMATDEPNNINIIYFIDPQSRQLGKIRLSLRR